MFTRNNKLRLRYVLCCLAIIPSFFVGAVGLINSSVAHVPAHFDVAVSVSDDLYEIEDAVYPLVNPDYNESEVDIPIIGVEGVEERDVVFDVTDSTPAVPALPREEILKIGSGDTLAGALQDIGVSGADAYKAVKALSAHYDPRDIKAGQAVSVTLEPEDDVAGLDNDGSGLQLGDLHMKLSATEDVRVYRDDMGRYIAEKKQKEVSLKMVAAKASIENSLYGSAARAGIPASMVAEMIRIYSYEIDFQRDIRQGDKVEILYETYETEDGDFARYGDVLFANLTVRGKKIPVYRYENKDGDGEYYKENGKSLKRTLMSTPIDGARMSSGYGMRRHPVLGYNKMHKGVDFAAPRGTPIFAAGDGVIEKAGRLGGYGNYIRIKHNSTLKTAYAHMSRFAKGIKAGKRVKQGQVIAYVGSTGRSTGPHLHFEVLKNGKQVNPKSVKFASAGGLKGSKLSAFKTQMAKIRGQYVSLSKGLEFARNDFTD